MFKKISENENLSQERDVGCDFTAGFVVGQDGLGNTYSIFPNYK